MGDQRGGRTEMRSFTERRRSCEKRISLTKGEDVTGETGETPVGGSMLQGGGGGASAAWGGRRGELLIDGKVEQERREDGTLRGKGELAHEAKM